MQRGGVADRPERVNPRTPLLLRGECVHPVETDAVVQRERGVDAPLVLQVEPQQVAVLAGIVDDGQRYVGDRHARVVSRESLHCIEALRVLVRERSAEARCVRGVERVRCIQLHADR